MPKAWLYKLLSSPVISHSENSIVDDAMLHNARLAQQDTWVSLSRVAEAVEKSIDICQLGVRECYVIVGLYDQLHAVSFARAEK